MGDACSKSRVSTQFTYRHLEQLGESSTQSPLRVIALIDYDAFYAQCETVRLGLSPKDPLAVRQWNAIIAINYPAREYGVKRGMSVEEATRLCPDLTLQHIATWREGDPNWNYRPDVTDHLTTDKAALDPYRIESCKTLKLVKDLLPSHATQRIEKASVDEFYIDLSYQVHQSIIERFSVLLDTETDPDKRLPLPEIPLDPMWPSEELVNGTDPLIEEVIDWDDISLSIGAKIVRNIRQRLRNDLGYTCSAGISHNKVLAKLGSGYRKPNQQTIVRTSDIASFLCSYKATRIPGLGGKLGVKLTETFGSDSIRDLLQVSREDMVSNLGNKQGRRVFEVIRGWDTSAVVGRTQVQSMLSAKTFVPFLVNIEQADRWLRIFAADLKSRFDEVNAELDTPRRPKTIAVHHHIKGRFGPTRTKQMAISPYSPINQDTFFALAKTILQRLDNEEISWPCMGISVSISNFDKRLDHDSSITSFFRPGIVRKRSSSESQSGQNKMRKEGGLLSINELVQPATSGVEGTVDTSAALGEFSDENRVLPTENVTQYQCPKCDSSIAADDVLEHLDWHVALEVQNSSQRSE
ncbi:hypothetical protein FSARC_5449 [Fusarium sarcochroum]|uniref:DNA polymerase eta n=1 Tax=Fusarium sarcochroum TaxID=1208366 RepID=A0A8H4XAE2_9HYPO|nr:hypothetical protein FSARC_5449 [Fusarium sarcochroum]